MDTGIRMESLGQEGRLSEILSDERRGKEEGTEMIGSFCEQ